MPPRPRTRRRNGPRRVPFTPPVPLVNRLSMRAFNSLYYRVNQAGTERATKHYRPFFYPLDALLEWNRIYGPRGFYQFQCVVPKASQDAAVRDSLQAIAASGQGSFLSVLKTFSDRPAAGMLSFPMAGTTLALDFPNLGASTLALLQRLCAIVDAAGGRLYPAKDAFMPPDLLLHGYPEWQRLRALSRPRHLVADVASPRRPLKGVMPQRILVFGATSAIAHAVSRRYAAAHASIVLIGRRAERARGQRRGSARSRRGRRPHRPARCSRPRRVTPR